MQIFRDGEASQWLAPGGKERMKEEAEAETFRMQQGWKQVCFHPPFVASAMVFTGRRRPEDRFWVRCRWRGGCEGSGRGGRRGEGADWLRRGMGCRQCL